MEEMVRVKKDHNVLSVRLPRWFVKESKLEPQDWMIWSSTKGGNLVLTKFDRRKYHDKDFERGKAK